MIRPSLSRCSIRRSKTIRPLWEIYAEDIGVENVQERMTTIREELEAAQKKAKSIRKKPLLRELPSYWNDYKGGRYKPEYEVDTGLPAEELSEITDRLTTYPADFHIHPKVKKLLEQRAEMGAGKRPVDYGMAEALAFGGLVKAGDSGAAERAGHPPRHFQPAALGAARYRE